MKKAILFILSIMIVPLVYGLASGWNLYYQDGLTTINGTDVCVNNGANCLSAAGGSYDLDVAGNTGTGSITNAETFTIRGGNNISTSMSGNILTIVYNGTVTASGGGNTTAEIRSVFFSSANISYNSATGQFVYNGTVTAAGGGNTTPEIWAVIDNNTFVKIGSVVSNITNHENTYKHGNDTSEIQGVITLGFLQGILDSVYAQISAVTSWISDNRTASELNIINWINNNRTQSETNIISWIDNNRTLISGWIDTNSTFDRAYTDTRVNSIDNHSLQDLSDFWNMTDIKLGINNLTACAEGEIPKYTSGAWVCGSDESGSGAYNPDNRTLINVGGQDQVNETWLNDTIDDRLISGGNDTNDIWVVVDNGTFAKVNDVTNNITNHENTFKHGNSTTEIQGVIDLTYLQGLLDSVYAQITNVVSWINANSTADRGYTDTRVESIDNHTATVDTFNTTLDIQNAINGSGYYDIEIPFSNLQDALASTDINFGNNELTYTFVTPSDEAFEIEGSGAFGGDLVHIHQHTGNPSDTVLLSLHAEDVDVLPLNISGVNTNAVNIMYGNITMLNGGVYSTDWTNVSITESQISDLSHTVDTTINNCTVDQSCDTIIYTTDKLFNTTDELIVNLNSTDSMEYRIDCNNIIGTADDVCTDTSGGGGDVNGSDINVTRSMANRFYGYSSSVNSPMYTIAQYPYTGFHLTTTQVAFVSDTTVIGNFSQDGLDLPFDLTVRGNLTFHEEIQTTNSQKIYSNASCFIIEGDDGSQLKVGSAC